jgi:hypothetical protein
VNEQGQKAIFTTSTWTCRMALKVTATSAAAATLHNCGCCKL